MDKTAAERMKRYRNKKRNETVTESPQSVTESVDSVTADVTVHPAIVRAITDPKIRPKIERISGELNSRGLGNDVRYGIDGPTFDVVNELLEVTR